MRWTGWIAGAVALLAAGCSSNTGATADAGAPDLVTAYSVQLSAELPGVRYSRRQASEVRTGPAPDTAFITRFEAVPAAVFGLSEIGSEAERTLTVSVLPRLLENGDILYTVDLAFADDAAGTPFGLTETPQLRVAAGQTGQVQLGQDDGDYSNAFTLDVSSTPVRE